MALARCHCRGRGEPQGVEAMLKVRVGALQVTKYPSPSFPAGEGQAGEGR